MISPLPVIDRVMLGLDELTSRNVARPVGMLKVTPAPVLIALSTVTSMKLVSHMPVWAGSEGLMTASPAMSGVR